MKAGGFHVGCNNSLPHGEGARKPAADPKRHIAF